MLLVDGIVLWSVGAFYGGAFCGGAVVDFTSCCWLVYHTYFSFIYYECRNFWRRGASFFQVYLMYCIAKGNQDYLVDLSIVRVRFKFGVYLPGAKSA